MPNFYESVTPETPINLSHDFSVTIIGAVFNLSRRLKNGKTYPRQRAIVGALKQIKIIS